MKKNNRVMLGAIVGSALLVGIASAELSVTVYNQNRALIRETRELSLKKGLQNYSFDGVAAAIDPTSVRFFAEGVNVLEQNFEFDLVNQQALLEKHIGEVIDVQLDQELVRGRLLSTRGGVIIENEDGEVTLIANDVVKTVRFPELPEGLVLKPTLRWNLYSKRGGKIPSELNYLTRDLGWEASYVAVVNENDSELDLSGWVQLTNRSGANYVDATLKLVAGDVQFEERRKRMPRGKNIMAMDMVAEGGFEEKSFFEYHLYTLPRKVTLHDNQTKQISLFEPATTSAKKIYSFNAWRGGDDVSVSLEFVNSEEASLGMPLPGGLVRMYKADDDGSLILIGEDRIEHTPKDEDVRLRTGDAFDVKANRQQIDMQRRGKTGRDVTYEVEIRNHKEEDVEVVVNERFYGDWSILSESMKGKKKDAMNYEYVVSVKANETVKVTYKVRFN